MWGMSNLGGLHLEGCILWGTAHMIQAHEGCLVDMYMTRMHAQLGRVVRFAIRLTSLNTLWCLQKATSSAPISVQDAPITHGLLSPTTHIMTSTNSLCIQTTISSYELVGCQWDYALHMRHKGVEDHRTQRKMVSTYTSLRFIKNFWTGSGSKSFVLVVHDQNSIKLSARQSVYTCQHVQNARLATIVATKETRMALGEVP